MPNKIDEGVKLPTKKTPSKPIPMDEFNFDAFEAHPVHQKNTQNAPTPARNQKSSPSASHSTQKNTAASSPRPTQKNTAASAPRSAQRAMMHNGSTSSRLVANAKHAASHAAVQYPKLILLGAFVVILALFIGLIVLSASKSSAKKELLAVQTKNTELATQVTGLEEKFKNTPLGNYIGEDLATDYPYINLYPEMNVTPVTPPPVDMKKNVVYLSFDDGPSKLTASILDTLKNAGVKSTFFVTALDLEAQKDILKRAVDEGHIIGIHTQTHDYESIYASVEAYLEDFSLIFTRVKEITGVTPNIFRFPGGSVNAYNRSTYIRIIAEMTRRGFTYYDWTVDTQDATAKPSSDKMMGNVNAQIEAGTQKAPVILMHDTKEHTAATVQQIIDAYKNAGYEFGTLDQRPACYFSYQKPKV